MREDRQQHMRSAGSLGQLSGEQNHCFIVSTCSQRHAHICERKWEAVCYLRSDNKTSADSTTDGNHSNLSRLQASVQMVAIVVPVVAMVIFVVDSRVLGGQAGVAVLLIVSNSAFFGGVIDHGRLIVGLLVPEGHVEGGRAAQLSQAGRRV